MTLFEGQAVMKTDDTALFNAIFEFKRETRKGFQIKEKNY